MIQRKSRRLKFGSELRSKLGWRVSYRPLRGVDQMPDVRPLETDGPPQEEEGEEKEEVEDEKEDVVDLEDDTLLHRDEAGDYWLITPAEIGRIKVEDAPFMAVELTTSGAGADQILRLRTNVDKIVTIDADHPIRCNIDPETGEPSPTLVMDSGVEARIARAVYYELVALGAEEKHDGETSFGVRSSGVFFPLGKLDGN